MNCFLSSLQLSVVSNICNSSGNLFSEDLGATRVVSPPAVKRTNSKYLVGVEDTTCLDTPPPLCNLFLQAQRMGISLSKPFAQLLRSRGLLAVTIWHSRGEGAQEGMSRQYRVWKSPWRAFGTWAGTIHKSTCIKDDKAADIKQHRSTQLQPDTGLSLGTQRVPLAPTATQTQFSKRAEDERGWVSGLYFQATRAADMTVRSPIQKTSLHIEN